MKVEMNKIQSKDHNMGWHRIHKIALFFTMVKSTFLKVDMVGYLKSSKK